MLLNIFFDNMHPKLELLLIGIFLFAVYWFILRKYNSLGLRLFVLCFFLFIATCVWLYKDESNLNKILNTGEERMAFVTSKSKTANTNEVEISFTSEGDKVINTKTSAYISQEEWDRFERGKPLSVIYLPSTRQTFVQQSIMRFKADKIYLYFFSGFWLVLGLIVYAWLRKYKVGVDENTGNEWVIKPDGGIILDERKSKGSRVAKRGNIISKLGQAFGK